VEQLHEAVLHEEQGGDDPQDAEDAWRPRSQVGHGEGSPQEERRAGVRLTFRSRSMDVRPRNNCVILAPPFGDR
jgi:hypothetical protein